MTQSEFLDASNGAAPQGERPPKLAGDVFRAAFRRSEPLTPVSTFSLNHVSMFQCFKAPLSGVGQGIQTGKQIPATRFGGE
jgi:hypothetical protein